MAGKPVTTTGTNGNDSLLGSSSDDSMVGGAGDDKLSGLAGSDSLFGGDGNDALYGGTENDYLDGGAGNDTLAGGSGADTLYGGTGMDFLDYSASSAGVSVNLNTGIALYGDAQGDVLAGVDGLIGTAYADTIVGFDGQSNSGDIYTNVFYGGAGNDSLDGLGGDDQLYGGTDADTVLGGSGNDLVQGDAGTDRLLGGDGNDTVLGGDGNDTAYGDAGNDKMAGDAGNDLLYGGDGNDSVSGGADNETVYGDAGDDSLTGDAGADSLFGGTGNDQLFGGTGADKIDGGAGTDTADYSTSSAAVNVTVNASANTGGDAQGDVLSNVENLTGSAYNDTLTGDSGANALSGGAGDDKMSGLSGSDSLSGGEGHDALYGGDGTDTISGGIGQDIVSGDAGNDSLFGGDGNDMLYGGSGNDNLTGGDGRDRFQFGNGGGADQISDFDMGVADGLTADQLDVSALSNSDGSPVKSFYVVVSDDGNGNAVLTFPGGETVVLDGVKPAQVATPGILHAMGVPCFAAGSRIITPEGPRPVEDLRVGDLVLTAVGVAPVLWRGMRALDGVALAERPELRPVRLKAGHYGLTRDLILSPQHAVRIGDTLIRARHLAEWGKGAHVARGMREVTYHHLLLPRHSLVMAEGTWAESLYPGREALLALDWRDRIAVTQCITGSSLAAAAAKCVGASFNQNIEELARAYGQRYLPLLTGREAQLSCSASRAMALSSQIGNEPHLRS